MHLYVHVYKQTRISPPSGDVCTFNAFCESDISVSVVVSLIHVHWTKYFCIVSVLSRVSEQTGRSNPDSSLTKGNYNLVNITNVNITQYDNVVNKWHSRVFFSFLLIASLCVIWTRLNPLMTSDIAKEIQYSLRQFASTKKKCQENIYCVYYIEGLETSQTIE